MKKVYSIITAVLMVIAGTVVSGCNPDYDIAYTLDGVWEGNMYKYYDYYGNRYSSTSTVLQFDQDAYSCTQGTGRWIDYYSDAPYDYFASYITWSVVNRRIIIYSEKERQTYYIDSYRLDDNYFEGVITDPYGNSKNFEMRKTYSRNWDSYNWNGWYYNAPAGKAKKNESTGSAGRTESSEKSEKSEPSETPITKIKAD